jgi:thiol-disulfide isomerase/thioredoxin
MVDLGSVAPSFRLQSCNPEVDGIEGDMRTLDHYSDARAVVIMFICNHCPYVKHVQRELVRLAADFAEAGVQFVAINSNDAGAYPEDSFDAMRRDAERLRYPFPYLFDESQAVARAYGAECTPDFFVYDGERQLVYRGRLDPSRPGQGESDGRELRGALDELLATGSVTAEQLPSMGCNIKWKPGNLE